jgi:hypothetical protein
MKPNKFSVIFTILASLLVPAAIITFLFTASGGFFSSASPFDPEFYYLAPALTVPRLIGSVVRDNETLIFIGTIIVYYLIGTGLSKIRLSLVKKVIIGILIAYYLLFVAVLAKEAYKEYLYRQELKADTIRNFESEGGQNLDNIFVPFDREKIDHLYSYSSDKAKVYELDLKSSSADNLPDLELIIYDPINPEASNSIMQELRPRFAGAGQEAVVTSVAGNAVYQNPDYRNMYLWTSSKYVIYFNTGSDDNVTKYLQKYPSNLK